MSADFVAIFLFSLLFLFLVRKVAKKIGLVDKPNYRKRHQGQIPLVGGISIYAGICFAFLCTDHYIPHVGLYLMCAGVLVVTGALDDRFDISVMVRAIIQALVAVAMMAFSGRYINSLGYIFGQWEMVLGPFGYLVTLFAVWAAINAFNMVDGIDGLLGGLCCVSLCAMGILLTLDNNPDLAQWCFAMIAAILPYILLNLGVFGRNYKVFMGDAGSTMIGFTNIWLLLQSTQGWGHPMNPVTALWIIAVPLMDMIAIMYRRMRKGMSPFAPDRQHIHHLIMRTGFSSRQAFIIITLTAALLAFFGVAGERWLRWPESVMLLLWIWVFLLYSRDEAIDNELDLDNLLSALWRGKVTVIACALAFVMGALIYSFVVRQEWTTIFITDKPTVNLLGSYFSQQQFLRNLGAKNTAQPTSDTLSIADEAYQEFLRQPASYDTRRDFWLASSYYQTRKNGDAHAAAVLLDKLINAIQFLPRDDVKKLSDSARLVAKTAPDANQLLRRHVDFANQRAANHLNENIIAVWAARTISLKVQVKRQESMYQRERQQLNQALKRAIAQDIERRRTDIAAERLTQFEIFLLGHPLLQARLDALEAARFSIIPITIKAAQC